MTVCLEMDTFFFQKRTLPTPPRCCTPFLINYPMTRQKLCLWRISQSSSYHS